MSAERVGLWLPAAVSLRGLHIAENDDVPEAFRGQLVSWGQLDPTLPAHLSRRGFYWIGDDGRPVKHEDKAIGLDIGAKHGYDARWTIAWRARDRYFAKHVDEIRFCRRFESRRRPWQPGEDQMLHFVSQLMMLAFAALFLGAFIVGFVSERRSGTLGGPIEEPFDWIVLGFYLAFLVVVPILKVFDRSRPSLHHALRLVVDQHSARVETTRGKFIIVAELLPPAQRLRDALNERGVGDGRVIPAYQQALLDRYKDLRERAVRKNRRLFLGWAPAIGLAVSATLAAVIALRDSAGVTDDSIGWPFVVGFSVFAVLVHPGFLYSLFGGLLWFERHERKRLHRRDRGKAEP